MSELVEQLAMEVVHFEGQVFEKTESLEPLHRRIGDLHQCAHCIGERRNPYQTFQGFSGKVNGRVFRSHQRSYLALVVRGRSVVVHRAVPASL
jgi:hypothetical protein